MDEHHPYFDQLDSPYLVELPHCYFAQDIHVKWRIVFAYEAGVFLGSWFSIDQCLRTADANAETSVKDMMISCALCFFTLFAMIDIGTNHTKCFQSFLRVA